MSYLFFSEGDECTEQQASEFNTTEQSQALLMLRTEEKENLSIQPNHPSLSLSLYLRSSILGKCLYYILHPVQPQDLVVHPVDCVYSKKTKETYLRRDKSENMERLMKRHLLERSLEIPSLSSEVHPQHLSAFLQKIPF